MYVFDFPAWRAHQETMIFLCEIENGQRDTHAQLAGRIHENTQSRIASLCTVP